MNSPVLFYGPQASLLFGGQFQEHQDRAFPASARLLSSLFKVRRVSLTEDSKDGFLHRIALGQLHDTALRLILSPRQR
jgi:hypothetical protein